MSGSSWSDFVNEPGYFGRSNRLGDWRENGSIIVWIHTQTKIHKRLFHMLPYVGMKKEEGKGEREGILYLPFVCHEEPARMQAKEKPLHCPVCRYMDWLAENSSISSTDIVWEASARDRKRDRICSKADFIGDIESGGDWRMSFKPQLQYILAVIKHPMKDDEQPELRVATEKFSLGEAIKRAVRNEIDSEGPELGDPGITPYAFKWVYDANARIATQYYSAYRYNGARASADIIELLNGPGPDLSSYLDPGDTDKLRDVMEKCVPPDIADEPALNAFFDNVKPNVGTEEEPWDEKEEKPPVTETKPALKRNAKRREAKKEEAERAAPPKVEPAKPVEEKPIEEPCVLCKGTGKWRGKDCIDCGGSGEKKDRIPAPRRTRGTKKETPPPPPPQPSDDDIVCGKCSQVVGEDDSVCPHCGAEFE